MLEIVKNIEEANCITHNGTIHADEVFATAFLELYLENIKLFRTTDVDFEKIKKEAIVYDVGRKEFDHHQPDALKRDNEITYSSFGLLWQRFGQDFLRKRNYSNIEDIFNGIDKDFVEAIDAIDNGFFPKIEADYKVKTLSDVIKLFNPSFKSNEEENIQFLKAVQVAKLIFEEEILNIVGKVTAKKLVLEKINSSTTKYLILDEFMPYEETILQETALENEKATNISFVIFPSNRGGYAIKTIFKSAEDKTPRVEIPEEWAGLSNEELEQTSGIKGLKFCHIGRFIISSENLESAIIAVEKILSQEENVKSI